MHNVQFIFYSHSFERVQQKSEQVWQFYLYGLVMEYDDKSALPPPLALIIHLYRPMRFIYRMRQNKINVANEGK